MTTIYKHPILGDENQYKELCEYAETDPESFWRNASGNLTWFEEPTQILPDYDHLGSGDISWFKDGKLNASYECIDRHIDRDYGSSIAYVCEPNYPSSKSNKYYTYYDLSRKVNRLTNIMRKHGIKKGDRVCIYLQMTIDLPVSMLACARIGAIHSVVFGGFSPQALASRIDDLKCNAIITQDTGHRGQKYHIETKKLVDHALSLCETNVPKVFIHEYTSAKIEIFERDVLLSKESGNQSYSECEPMSAEDPLFVLYTSGSTGKPKGVLHTTGGFLVNAAYTHKLLYSVPAANPLQWICADLGWSTGHTYGVYAPLINGTSGLIFEGSITYPTVDRVWKIIEENGVDMFQIAPTGLRMLMKYGNKPLEGKDLSTLKLLGTVGEPMKEPEWKWLFEKIGNRNCPIIDTWWQTETGACQLSIVPGINKMKPGSLGYSLPGCKMVLLDPDGNEIIENEKEGSLYMKNCPPSTMRTIYNDHDRFKEIYLSPRSGYFFTGDRAKRDSDGMFYVLGREDDTIQVSGILVGTAEVEGCIQEIPEVVEAAIVSIDNEITSECIVACVVLEGDKYYEHTDALCGRIREHVKRSVGSFASPHLVAVVPDLPKTRSGKIMRRLLRKMAADGYPYGEEVSTLVNPDCLSEICDAICRSKRLARREQNNREHKA